MDAFSGNFNSQRVQNHSFNTKDKLLVSLGFASFNKANCYDIFQKTMEALAIVYPNLQRNGLLPPFPKGGTILDISNSSGFYYPFNKSTKKYDIEANISLSEMYSLIDYHEKRQQGRVSSNGSFDRQIKAIQNSISGSVRINFPTGSIIPGQSNTALIELVFQKKAQRSAARQMTNIGPPMLTGVGRTPAGTAYAGNGTRDHQSESSQNMGSYLPPAEGGQKNPYNGTTAPLKLHYNSTEKTWEAGTTQMLARLLTAVAAADVNDVSPPVDGGVADNRDFYDPNGRYYSGAFTTGIAMPLSIENGNPYMLGPNIIECQNKKIEKVRCVNRSPKEYAVGTIVMLNNINGEWIITSLGEANLKPKAPSVQDWAFSKMIVDSDTFFKDGRYYREDDYQNYSRNITPSFYESRIRAQFYNLNTYTNILSKIEKVFGPSGLAHNVSLFNYDIRKTVGGKSNPNYVGDDYENQTTLSPRYIVTSAFDIMNERHGGFTPDDVHRTNSPPVEPRPQGGNGYGKLIDKINAFDETFSGSTTLADVFPFWGPVFTEGYRAISTNSANLEKSDNDLFYFSKSSGIDISEFDRKNFPAEATSRIIDTKKIIENIADDLGTANSNKVRTPIVYPPFYLSSTISTKHVQFIPLTDNLVGHTDQHTRQASNFGGERKFYNQVYGPNGLITSLENKHLHGNIVKRNKFINLEQLDPQAINQACYSSNYGNSFNGIYNENKLPVIPYDCYVKRPVTKPGLGAPRYFRDGEPYLGANCVGIIAGMCIIGKPGGGDINFEIKQNVGLVAQLTDVVSVIDPITSIGGLFSLLLGGSSGGVSYELPQWGSNDDAIDSFGTTALHIRIFDYWEDRDTFYDPRYFAVLHFNPVPSPEDLKKVNWTDNFGDLARTIPAGLTVEELNQKYQNPNGLYLQSIGFPVPESVGRNYIPYEERPRRVDAIDSPVDFRVPTLDTAVDLGERFLEKIPSDDLGTVLKPGAIINSNTALRPENEWRVNTIRRGQLLSGNGFIYPYSVIGINNENLFYIANRGTGFKENEEIDCGKGVVVTIEEVDGQGQIKNFYFTKESEIDYFKQAGIKDFSFGEGFVSSDFKSSETESGELDGDGELIRCYRLEIPSPDKDGESAIFEYTQGKVWSKVGYDAPPKEHVPITRISVGSRRGQIARTSDLYKEQTVTLGLGSNSSGAYRMFTFFHNDITHTPATSRTYAPNFLQYLDLNII